jgi:hypothetical protein
LTIHAQRVARKLAALRSCCGPTAVSDLEITPRDVRSSEQSGRFSIRDWRGRGGAQKRTSRKPLSVVFFGGDAHALEVIAKGVRSL